VGEIFQSSELFLSDRISITERLTVDLGVHSAKDYFLDETFIEPRISAAYAAHEDLDLYARYGRHHTSPDPRDLLILSAISDVQESERSTQALVGGRWDIADGWRLQTEAWFKDFEQKELIGTALERKLTGDTYGLDVLLAKPISERLYGWVALSLSEGEISDPNSGLSVTNQYAPPVSITVAASYAFDNGWMIGAKYRTQSGDPFTPLMSVNLDPLNGTPQPVFGEPFSERLDNYHRLDVRLEKAASYDFGDVLYYVDILNVTDRKNAANRSFPLRNTTFFPPDPVVIDAPIASILPDDENGIPFFVAFGVNLSF
jgi:outer membrane receptor protein involved in Fe transport